LIVSSFLWSSCNYLVLLFNLSAGNFQFSINMGNSDSRPSESVSRDLLTMACNNGDIQALIDGIKKVALSALRLSCLCLVTALPCLALSSHHLDLHRDYLVLSCFYPAFSRFVLFCDCLSCLSLSSFVMAFVLPYDRLIL
jgi:hypothetical protein